MKVTARDDFRASFKTLPFSQPLRSLFATGVIIRGYTVTYVGAYKLLGVQLTSILIIILNM